MRRGCWSFWGRIRLRGVGLGFGENGLAVAVEAAGLHGGYGFGVLHEGLPDEGGAEIFCHEQADAKVDTEDVGVVPEQIWVEGVAESVAAPGVSAEVIAERAEDVHAVARKEGKRSGGSAGNDGPVDGAQERRATPGGVTVLPI